MLRNGILHDDKILTKIFFSFIASFLYDLLFIEDASKNKSGCHCVDFKFERKVKFKWRCYIRVVLLEILSAAYE